MNGIYIVFCPALSVQMNILYRIKLWGYNIETVMAEKVETVLSRGIFNTRPRDYYDFFVLSTTQKYDKKLFQKAFATTAVYRGSAENIAATKEIITLISGSEELQDMWAKYQKKFVYAQDITYGKIMQFWIDGRKTSNMLTA